MKRYFNGKFILDTDRLLTDFRLTDKEKKNPLAINPLAKIIVIIKNAEEPQVWQLALQYFPKTLICQVKEKRKVSKPKNPSFFPAPLIAAGISTEIA